MSISQNYPIVSPSLNLDFSNTKTLDPRITFSRPTGAVYYDGKTVAKSEENLFLRSQEFDNAYWTKTRSTVTANSTTAPDGTTTAELVSQSSGQIDSGSVSRSFTGSANAFVISIFAKKEAKDFIIIREEFSESSSAKSTWFNISTGTVGTTASGHTASITSVGNGWYRCAIAFTADASRTGPVIFYLADTDNSTTVTDSGGIYLWGAQVEARDSVTAYTPTTTQPITNYIPTLLSAPANTARFDHDPVTGESLGLLVEEQRTNLVLRSEEFDDSYWTKGANSALLSNQTIAPDGTLTADKFYLTASGTVAGLAGSLSRSVSALGSGTFTASIYVKSAGFRWVRFENLNTQSGNDDCWFDIIEGVIGTVGSACTPSIVNSGNGWFRISVSGVKDANQDFFWLTPVNNNGSISYTGDGYSGIYIWGAQLEAGSFPTSYIKTEASQVTRSADSASMTGANFSDWYRQGLGTWTVNLKPPRNLFFTEIINLTSANNYIELAGSSSATFLRLVAVSNNAVVDNFSSSTAYVDGDNIAAISYGGGVDLLVLNGNSVTTNTNTNIPFVSSVNFGGPTSGQILNGTIKKIAYYPVAVTPTQLQALTS